MRRAGSKKKNVSGSKNFGNVGTTGRGAIAVHDTIGPVTPTAQTFYPEQSQPAMWRAATVVSKEDAAARGGSHSSSAVPSVALGYGGVATCLRNYVYHVSTPPPTVLISENLNSHPPASLPPIRASPPFPYPPRITPRAQID